jgi:NhaP-type Na+/H+ and K+/H+ antiporter
LHFATTLALVGIVIVVASLVSGLVERSGAPIVAVFLALGALLGEPGLGLIHIGFDSPVLQVLATLALALVLFSDAVTVETTAVRERRRLILMVLGPGTLIPAALVALAARLLLDVPWAGAAILGAALSSTDPVLLRSLLRSPALSATSKVALRVETGMNDVALLPVVVLAMFALRAAGDGAPVADGELTRSVVGLFVLGPLIGAVVGWVGIRLLARIRSSLGVRRDYESLYALGLAFTGFAFAEAAGGSGFLAAFAAGLMVGSQDVELCDCFLEYGEATAEMLLLLTFVALGTSVIWSGLAVLDGPTLLFAAIALAARTVVLWPVLSAAGVRGADRRLVALLGPRGLSSLLLALLPVFAGIRGAERWFAVTCLVVLCSALIHGVGIALHVRRVVPARSARRPAPPPAPEGAEPTAEIPATITVDEVRALRARGEEVVIVDARADRNRNGSAAQAAGSVRIRPDDPVRDATEQRLSQRATLVVYCA